MTRQIAYLGDMERVDFRPAFGLAGDDSEKGRKYLFFGRPGPGKGKRRTAEEIAEAARQHREGTTLTNDDAAKLLTDPYCPAGFYDLTDAAAAPVSSLDAQEVAPLSLGINATLTPVDAAVYDKPETIELVVTPTPEPAGAGAGGSAGKGKPKPEGSSN